MDTIGIRSVVDLIALKRLMTHSKVGRRERERVSVCVCVCVSDGGREYLENKNETFKGVSKKRTYIVLGRK